MAKLIIRFINGIAETVNADPDMDGVACGWCSCRITT